MPSPFRAALALLLLAPALAAAQPAVSPTVFAAWQGRAVTWRAVDGTPRQAAAHLAANAGRDARERPLTVVLSDPGTAREPLTDHARHLADLVARELGVPPDRLVFLFRLPLVGERRRPLWARATFRLARDGDAGAPLWRLLAPDEVEDHTDRAFR